MDYITDNEEEFLKSQKAPIGDEELDKEFFRLLEIEETEIDNEPTIAELGIDMEEIRKQPISYRHKISGFPLDHKIKCEKCLYVGKVGFRQRFCPECAHPLIPSSEATEPDGYVARRPQAIDP